MSNEDRVNELDSVEDRIAEVSVELGVLLRRRAELLGLASGTSPAGTPDGSLCKCDGRVRGSGERYREQRKSFDTGDD